MGVDISRYATKAFYAGKREGIQEYAHWKDGVQYVGSCGRTLKDALADIDKEERHELTQCEIEDDNMHLAMRPLTQDQPHERNRERAEGDTSKLG